PRAGAWSRALAGSDRSVVVEDGGRLPPQSQDGRPRDRCRLPDRAARKSAVARAAHPHFPLPRPRAPRMRAPRARCVQVSLLLLTCIVPLSQVASIATAALATLPCATLLLETVTLRERPT